jgi:hypothetical protein
MSEAEIKINRQKKITKLLQYMDSHHKIREFFAKYEKVTKEVSNEKSTSDSKMLVLFFETILSFYYERNLTPIVAYQDPSINDTTRVALLRAIFPNIQENMAITLFDKVDLMYVIIYKVLKKLNKGFIMMKDDCKTSFQSEMVLSPDIDLLFYIVCYNTFPDDLKLQLRSELHILTTMEHKILTTCSGIFMKDEKICNILEKNRKQIELGMECKQKGFLANLQSIATEVQSTEPLKISKPSGVLALIMLFRSLRPFGQRRPSKM